MREEHPGISRLSKLLIIGGLVVTVLLGVGFFSYGKNFVKKDASIFSSEIKVNLQDSSVNTTGSKVDAPGMPGFPTPTPSISNISDGNLTTYYGDVTAVSVKVHFATPKQVTRVKVKIDCMNPTYCQNLPKPYAYTNSAIATINTTSASYDPKTVVLSSISGAMISPVTWIAKFKETANKPDGTMKEYILPSPTTATDVYIYLDGVSPNAPGIYELEVYSQDQTVVTPIPTITPTNPVTPAATITPTQPPTDSPTSNFTTRSFAMVPTTTGTGTTTHSIPNYTAGDIGQNFGQDFVTQQAWFQSQDRQVITTIEQSKHPTYKILDAQLPQFADVNLGNLNTIDLVINYRCATYTVSGMSPSSCIDNIIRYFDMHVNCIDCVDRFGPATYDASIRSVTRNGDRYVIQYGVKAQMQQNAEWLAAKIDNINITYTGGNETVSGSWYDNIPGGYQIPKPQYTNAAGQPSMHRIYDFNIESLNVTRYGTESPPAPPPTISPSPSPADAVCQEPVLTPDLSNMKLIITDIDGNKNVNVDQKDWPKPLSDINSFRFENIVIKNTGTADLTPDRSIEIKVRLQTNDTDYIMLYIDLTEGEALPVGGEMSISTENKDVFSIIEKNKLKKFGTASSAKLKVITEVISRTGVATEQVTDKDVIKWSGVLVSLTKNNQKITDNSICEKSKLRVSELEPNKTDLYEGYFQDCQYFVYQDNHRKYVFDVLLGSSPLSKDQPPGGLDASEDKIYSVNIEIDTNYLTISAKYILYNVGDWSDSNITSSDGYIILEDSSQNKYKALITGGLAVINSTIKSEDGSKSLTEGTYKVIEAKATFNDLEVAWPSKIQPENVDQSTDPFATYDVKYDGSRSLQDLYFYSKYKCNNLTYNKGSKNVCIYGTDAEIAKAGLGDNNSWSQDGFVMKDLLPVLNQISSFPNVKLNITNNIIYQRVNNFITYEKEGGLTGSGAIGLYEWNDILLDIGGAIKGNFDDTIFHEFTHEIDNEFGRAKFGGDYTYYSETAYPWSVNVDQSSGEAYPGSITKDTGNKIWLNIIPEVPGKIAYDMEENKPIEIFAEQLTAACLLSGRGKNAMVARIHNALVDWKTKPSNYPADYGKQLELSKRITGDIPIYNDDLTLMQPTNIDPVIKALFNDAACKP